MLRVWPLTVTRGVGREGVAGVDGVAGVGDSEGFAVDCACGVVDVARGVVGFARGVVTGDLGLGVDLRLVVCASDADANANERINKRALTGDFIRELIGFGE